MKVSEMMTQDVCVVAPGDSLRDAARMMVQKDIGSVPVGENDRLVGFITDRDIAVRAVAEGKDPMTAVREVMSEDVKYCFENDDVEEVSRNMADLRIRRLPVVDVNKRLVGIVSLANFAHSGDDSASDSLLKGVAAPH